MGRPTIEQQISAAAAALARRRTGIKERPSAKKQAAGRLAIRLASLCRLGTPEEAAAYRSEHYPHLVRKRELAAVL